MVFPFFNSKINGMNEFDEKFEKYARGELNDEYDPLALIYSSKK